MAVISRATSDGDIPEWEQRLSAGAVCMTLIIAAQAMGYGANWITDWYAYDADAGRLLGLADGERVAGFVHLGTQRRRAAGARPTGRRVAGHRLDGLTPARGVRLSAPDKPRRPGRAARGPRAARPVCQKTSIGMPPRGYQ